MGCQVTAILTLNPFKIMKSRIILITLALAGVAYAAWTPKDSAVDYPTMTVPAAGDAIPIWDAGTDATQQIFWSTFVSSFQGLDADLTSWGAITPGTGVGAFITTPSSANLRGALTDESGTGVFLTANGVGAALTVTASGFNGNLATTDDTVQEIAQKLDDLSAVGFDATAIDAVTFSDGANASNVWTFNLSGTDPTLTFASGIITVGGNFAITGSFTAASMAVSGALSAGSFEFEGSTADGFETTLGVVDPTADNAILLPNASGTVALAQIVTKSTAANYTIGTTDSRELYGGTIYVTGAATITIPAVAAGASFTVITIGAVAVSVDPNAADLIYLDGTALADGDKVTNTSTAGDVAVFTYLDGTGWYASTNAWTDGN